MVDPGDNALFGANGQAPVILEGKNYKFWFFRI